MFDTEKFIVLVQEKQSIWNIGCKEYSNRDIKMKDWNEVCKEMTDNWDTLSTEEKTAEVKQLQVKWKNIKDNFRKTFQIEKTQKSGSSYATKKKYYYYDQLSFLLPVFAERNLSSSLAPSVSVVDERNTEDDMSSNSQVESPTLPGSAESLRNENLDSDTTGTPVSSVKKRKTKNTVQEKLLQILSKRENVEMKADEDDDRMFLLSLLPTLKRIPSDKRMRARIELMQVLDRYNSNSELQTTFQQPYTYYSQGYPSTSQQGNMYNVYTSIPQSSGMNLQPHQTQSHHMQPSSVSSVDSPDSECYQ